MKVDGTSCSAGNIEQYIGAPEEALYQYISYFNRPKT